MLTLLIRRFISLVLVLWCVITITFFLVRSAPGSPFARERSLTPAIEEELKKRFNLSGTLWEQYTTYLGLRKNPSGEYSGLLQGNLQPSIKYRDRSVNELVGQNLPVTATLGAVAFFLATTVGVWLGTLAAVRHRTAIDTSAMLTALALISIPNFAIGPILVLIFALWLGWLPVGGWASPSSLILPAITLAGPYIAYIARLTRSSMLEVLKQDFVRTAHAKGLSEQRAIYKHVLKIGILPVVSYMGPLAANLLTGSIVVEMIFNLPGIGSFFVLSILARDHFLLIGVVILYCTLLVLLNLVVDLAYSWLDPRIRLEA